MSEAEINIAIAEVCGWTDIQTHDGFTTGHKPGEADPSEWRRWHLPNYTGDLNAMHEAWLRGIQGDDVKEDAFSVELLRAVGAHTPSVWGRPNGSDATWALASNATARQRAEAFLRTFNKWKD